MATLTKIIKERIAQKAVNATFLPKSEAMKKREHKLAQECYNHVFPKEIRDIIETVPKYWLRHCNCLRFNVLGWDINLNADKEYATPYYDGCGILGNIDGDLGKKVQDFSQEKKTLKDDWRNATLKIIGFFEQFRNFKKLEEAWPEGRAFYKEFSAERPASNVPALITSEINEMLGIKPKEAA